MFVYLLTGIWYEPGSKVFKLLETLEYRWIDVLPRLLSENPAERPTNISELVETLLRARRSRPTEIVARAESLPEADALRPPLRKRRVLFALAGAAAVIAAVSGYFLFSRLSAPVAADDFDAAFSAVGIYEEARQ
jgi:hypothetical protein